MKRTFLVAGMLAASLLAGGVGGYAVMNLSDSGETSAESRTTTVDKNGFRTASHFTSYEKEKYPDLTYAAENAVKAVVNIEKIEEVQTRSNSGRDPFFEFFGIPQGYFDRGGNGQGSTQERRSGGSGVIISEDGYIVTNNHVVENASKLKVKLNDGRTFPADIVGTDPTTDVALIKIDAKELPVIPFGSSDNLRLGEWVLAIGSPFDLQSTITAGIVSAKARKLDVIPDKFRIESFIQTDAAVNPGNSGGALVNTAGELVGINTVIQSPTGSYIGYSFAVPETIVKKVVMDLREYGVVQRAMLGVVYAPINEAFIESKGKELGITEIGGAYVDEVDPDGAAAAAGIKKGDIIVEIDGAKVDDSAVLSEQIGRHRPNDKVNILVKRGGQTKPFEVILRNKAGKAEPVTKDYVDGATALGGEFAEVGDKLRKELKIDGGARVVSIKSGGILAKARVKEGFIITHINEKSIRTVRDLERITGKITAIDGIYPNGRAASYSLVE